MRAFSTLDGLKTMTRRGRIGTSTPVLGLRPIRSLLERTTNEPNDESFTVSPRAAASQISSRNSAPVRRIRCATIQPADKPLRKGPPA